MLFRSGYGSFNLNGRSIGAGGLPRPAYTIQEEGRIVINITVDPKGNVIFAEIGKGTNIDNGSLVKYIICHSEIFVNFLFVEATVQIFVHVLRYTKAGGVYMSTYEKLQDQTCADGIDVMDYEFNSPNIKGLYCNSTVAINNSI